MFHGLSAYKTVKYQHSKPWIISTLNHTFFIVFSVGFKCNFNTKNLVIFMEYKHCHVENLSYLFNT